MIKNNSRKKVQRKRKKGEKTQTNQCHMASLYATNGMHFVINLLSISHRAFFVSPDPATKKKTTTTAPNTRLARE